MSENTIVEGKFKANMLFRILCVLGGALLIIGLIYCGIRYSTGEFYKSYGFGYGLMMPYNYEDSGYSYFSLLIAAMCFEREIMIAIFIYLGIVLIAFGFFFNLMMSKCAITVTDKRVIGKANFGKRVDLPLNQISAVAQGMFSSIAVATSSGRICFWFLENRDNVFDSLSDLIRDYQIQKADVSNKETNVVQQVSGAEELKKYKELLDQGIISPEEFDAKKKQILGL